MIDDHITYKLMFRDKIDVYSRYPDQLLTALAKVGGLLGLLKLISFFLAIHHQRLFENGYRSQKVMKTVTHHLGCRDDINKTSEGTFLGGLIEEKSSSSSE